MEEIKIMKLCKKCNTEKEAKDFNKQSSSRDGLSGYCRQCKSDLNKAKYNSAEFDKMGYIEKQKEWQKKNPEQFKKTLEKYRNKE